MWWKDMQRSAHSRNLDYIKIRSDSIFIEWIARKADEQRRINKEKSDHVVEANVAFSHSVSRLHIYRIISLFFNLYF